MTTLPIAHNGQIFDLVPVPGYASAFRVVVDREVVFGAYEDEEGSWDYQEARVEEALGSIEIHRDGYLFAQGRHNGERRHVSDLTEALAFIVEEARPCEHGDARCLDDDHNVWECDGCSAIYRVLDDHGNREILRYFADARREETRLRF